MEWKRDDYSRPHDAIADELNKRTANVRRDGKWTPELVHMVDHIMSKHMKFIFDDDSPCSLRCHLVFDNQAIADELNQKGAGPVIAPRHAEDDDSICELVDMSECEDADGIIWPDCWQCCNCGAMVSGILPESGTMVPPKFCPNCAARVVGEVV